MKYLNKATGTTLEVVQNGKGFITRRHYLATKNTASETVEKKHATYSPVEKLIAKYNFERID